MSDDIRSRRKLTLDQLFAPAPPYRHPTTKPLTAGEWQIYRLTHIIDDKIYIGVTSQSLKERIAGHIAQAKRGGAIRAGGLMAAIRHMLGKQARFEDTFAVATVAYADDVDDARVLERRWVDMLGCRVPHGLNGMPGGSSVGGEGNAKPLDILLPNGTRQGFLSIHRAIADRNWERRRAGHPILDPGVVYARLSVGWPPEEALGYRPHVDGRGGREPFQVDGQTYTRLRDAAVKSGITVGALRSRHHRRRATGSQVDLGVDLREIAGTTRAAPLRLAWHRPPGWLHARDFAAAVCRPTATILHRWHQARRRGLKPETMAPAELRLWLTTHQDRRKPIQLTLPDGQLLCGGERELVRRVLDDTKLERGRATRLSESGVRRRIRTLSEADRLDPSRVAWAFGFEDCPTRSTDGVA